jgi:hypothetical protein
MTSATMSLPTAATGETVTVEAAPRKSGFFARLMAALIAARMRQAERDIARYKHLIREIKAD